MAAAQTLSDNQKRLVIRKLDALAKTMPRELNSLEIAEVVEEVVGVPVVVEVLYWRFYANLNSR